MVRNMFRSNEYKSNSNVLNSFIPDQYYFKVDAYHEEISSKTLASVYLRPEGIELIAQYYREKYHSDITLFYDADALLEFLAKSKFPNNSRKAFILISGDERPHASPVIYLNENNEEVLFSADSLGTTDENAKAWVKQVKYPFYYVSDARQSDRVSCYVDALTFARDTTAIDKSTKNYRILSLLTKLKSRGTKVADNLYTAKLPDELLVTSQLPAFVENHKECNERIIHKTETLSLFRKRYTDYGDFIVTSGRRGEIKKSNPANYLRMKGLKMLNIIEIQFYLNELRKHLCDVWIPAMRAEFIQGADVVLASDKPNMKEFAESFISRLISKTTNSVCISKP